MANMNQNGGGIGTMMQPKKKFKMQGGVRNYLGNQKQVKAPLNWQSSPDHPKTELAYITKKEKDLLVKKDLHGSLKGGVNRGPSGIMSLNGFGSTDSSQNVSGSQMSAAETGGSGSGMTSSQASAIRSAAINAGAGQKVNPGFFGGKYNNTVSQAEIAAARAARNNPNNRFGAGAYDRTRGFGSTGIGGLMRGFNPLSMILGLINPFLGIASRGIGSLKGGFKGLAGKMRGINESGEPNTQAEYEAMVNNRRTEGRRDKMQERIDRGYNSIFGMRTGPITDQQRSTLANLNTQTGISNNVIGGDPTSTRFDGFKPRVGNTNNMPKVNVTGLDSNITSDQINEFGDGRSITSDQINEFGDNRNINIDEFTPGGLDRSNVYENFTDNRDLISEFATPGTMNQNAMEQDYGMYSGLPNQKLTNDAAMSVMMEGYNNSLPPPDNYNMGTEFGLQPAEGFQNPNALYDDFSNGEVAYYPAEHRLASITNNQLPGNNLMADVSANDLSRIGKYNENQDIGDIRMFEPSLNQTLTDQEIKNILDGTITEPTGQFARNGGIMGYGRG